MKFVVIDVETTGNAPHKGDKIIQIGAAVVENGKLIQTYSTYVYPQKSIPAFISQLTGITDKDVAGAPVFSEVAPQILELMKDSYFVAHNVPFDFSFINEELKNAGFSALKNPVLDTVECARILFPTASGYSLSALAEWLGLTHDRPHQADSDAIVTASVLIKVLHKISQLPAASLKSLKQLSPGLASQLEPILINALSVKRSTGRLDDKSFETYRGITIKKKRSLSLEASRKTVEGQFNKSFFVKGGTLENRWDGFQWIEGQQEMADAVWSAFNDHSHLLAEAGTGTGKTLAYLYPALQFTKESGSRVVISTHTLHLQEQLLEKEIPVLKKVLDFPFQAAMLKGKSNYLCLRKLERVLKEKQASYEETLGLAQLIIWVLETDRGDLEEISLAGGQQSLLWDQILTDSDSLKDDPWADKNYYYRAGEEAEKADIIITNHALLFSDIVKENQLLPVYKHAVLDEAHHLDELAGKHLGFSLSYLFLNQLLSKVNQNDTRSIIQRLAVYEKSYIHYFHENWYQRRQDNYALLKYECDELFRTLHTFTKAGHQKKQSETGGFLCNYEPSHLQRQGWSSIHEAAERFIVLIEEETEAWNEFHERLSSEIKGTQFEIGWLEAFRITLMDITVSIESLIALLFNKKDNYVYWIEAGRKGELNSIVMYGRPINVNDLLADKLFAEKFSVVMTSASLTVKKSFSYIIENWGLEDFAPQTIMLPSPYHFKRNTKLLIPSDMPLIKDGERDYINDAAEFIYHAASISDGKMLVLFTSFDMLRKTYFKLREWDDEGDFYLIGQGMKSGSRSKLIKTFRQNEKAILFGTNAFWEGVDIPGEDLSCLIIVRLPFAPPDEPVMEAKSQHKTQSGSNPFTSLSLPQAVLRFKQGFGRLIRHKQDRGVVIVLDNRLIKSSYGKEFLESLPPVPVKYLPTPTLLNELADFMDK
ncbi:ATP-dependent DNA helicase DinG [Alteribacillus sp. HJP-4]|uniref:ATP-dependent DNA helicase DinG n=1 Tax=Alteribacillus sp. HJP-4 TaxID=2775394 RepID=UPI0035CD0A95